MRKPVNLKQRLDALRDEPEAAVAVALQLDADVYRVLQRQARREQITTEAYIARLLVEHVQNQSD